MKKVFLAISMVCALGVSTQAKSILPEFTVTDSLVDSYPTEVIRIDFTQFDHITLYAQAFQGVPYRWGGVSETTGFDCSGFMKYLFGEFGYEIPHSAAAIAQMGARVDRSELQKGDLVFFKTSRKKAISHVGMVIEAEDGEVIVIHASSSRGVVAENLNRSTYLSSRFVRAVRLDLDAIRKPSLYY
ncbi:MAG: C40 family peptidase [Bacteroidia bacterium]|nr:C40 family peptidase [Bacteroidia bacterium]